MIASSDPRLDELSRLVRRVVQDTPVIDVHTHLYDPAFGSLLLWGIDDLLVYHYLVAEAFRTLDLPYDAFWRLTKEEQADLVWKALFIDRSPVSEAARGVVTILNRLGIDPRARDLPALRAWFASRDPAEHLSRCLDLAGVCRVYMTNSPFDPLERPIWDAGFRRDPRFVAALRIDPLLVSWSATAPSLVASGHLPSPALEPASFAGARRFLEIWAARLEARYVMVSLPPSFRYPDGGETATLIREVVLPFCRSSGLPFALMLGVKRAVNPSLQLAGDGVGWADIASLEALCSENPEVKFLATVLSRENQHSLCVAARKFRNLHPFGCWWFTNVPSIIDEMTRMRLELLGLSFTPQHSDARVLDQVVYKWEHSREIVAGALSAKYLDLARSGWFASETEIRRDARELLGYGFERFCGVPEAQK